MTPLDGDGVGQIVENNRDALEGLIRHVRDDVLDAWPDPLTPESFGGIAAGVHELGDQQMAAIIARARRTLGRSPACSKGCGMCCYQKVEPTSSELALMAAAILGGGDADQVRDSCARTVARLASVSDRYAASIPCPLLERGRVCGIYAYRPAMCRGHLSLSRVACEKDWRHRGKADYAEKARIPMIGETPVVQQAVRIGADAAARRKGLQMVRVELAHGLLGMLRPGALELWLAGGELWQDVPDEQIRRDYTDTLDRFAA